MGYAEVISLPEVRARKQWEALRQQLHERFDQWLDAVEAQLPASAPTPAPVTETIWALRQQLTGGMAQTIVEHTQHAEQRRTSLPCATCMHHLRGRRPGQARWRHEWREATGFRFSLIDGERIVQVMSWHQIYSEHELGEALRQVKEAGLIPAETVRLCVICDGAEWMWKHVQGLFPEACQVLDYYHCAEYLHKMAKAQYGSGVQAQQWIEATLTRLYLGQIGKVLGGLRRMQPKDHEALKAIDNCWVYLHGHRGRTNYRQFRRGGYPLGSGGMESANKFICHVRLKRSGAWWYETNSNQMLALRCAKYNGTFARVFERYRQLKKGA